MKKTEIVQNFIPVILLCVIIILMIHPAVRMHKVSIAAGWVFSTLVFYPAIFIVQRALREQWKIAHLIPLVLMTFRMIALMISLLILTKFKKEWLIPFSVVLLSSLPVYFALEIKSTVSLTKKGLV